ncbi:MFS transporter [Streptomyces sp. NPDC048638]|uniref:MFS transporter n=1 Tax=Streptomyces sp. NPDC048638 TaxID=3365580 RepID=UPI0037197A92
MSGAAVSGARGIGVPDWRGGFGRLWSAAAVSRFGDALRGTALPLLAYDLTRSPVQISLVTACEFLPWLCFGLLGGAVADRVDQRRAMWAVDLLRGLLTAVFALVVALGGASIGLLIVLACTLTTLQTLFDNAATALLPVVVPKEALAAANARLLTGQQVLGRFVGGPLAPALIALGAAVPFLADAATYVVAAVLVSSLRTTPQARPPAGSGRTLRREIVDGTRALWRDRVLRAFSLSVALGNIGIGALIATLVVVVKDWLRAGDFGYAAVTTGYGIGMVLGGLFAARVVAALGGQARTLLLAGLLQAAVLVALGTLRSLWPAVASLAVFGFASMVWSVLETTVVQQRSPAGMIGRIGAAFRTVSVAGTPLGALLGGAAAAACGPRTPALLTAGLLGLGAAVLIPVRNAADSSPSDSGQIPHTAP